MSKEQTYSDKAVLTQREGAKFLGISRHKFRALEKANYFRRLDDPNGGVGYLKVDLERLWNDPRAARTNREERI